MAEYDTNYYNDIVNTIGKIDGKQLGEKYGADFRDAILNAITADNKELKLDNLFAQIDPREYEELSKMDASQWKEALGLTDEEFSKIGLDSSETFAKNFQQALENYHWSTTAAINAAMNSYSEEDLEKIDLKQDEFATFGEHLMEVADDAKELADDLMYDSDAALIVAKSIMRMNNGVDKLADNYEDWISVLKKSQKSSEEYSDALHGMQDALADILDTEDKLITDDFVQKHFKEIEKAAKGDAEAIDELHKELAKDIVINAATNFGATQQEIDQMIADLDSLKIPDIKVGASLDMENLEGDEAQFMETMQNIIKSAGLTADEANALFGQMGFQAQFATEEVPTKQVVPEYVTETAPDGETTVQDIGPDGQTVTRTFTRTRTRTYQDGTYEASGKMTAIAMETDANGNKTNVPKITGMTKKAGGSFNNYSSKNKGGKKAGKGGGDSKPDKMDKVSVEPDRYHKVNTQITKVDNSLKKLQSQQDKFIGNKKIANLNAQ